MSKPLATTPSGGDTYRHVRSGGYYTVVCIAYEEATERPVVVYRSHQDGRTWTRPLEEFCDGRFETQFAPVSTEATDVKRTLMMSLVEKIVRQFSGLTSGQMYVCPTLLWRDGIDWDQFDEALKKHGLCLRKLNGQYPMSLQGLTVLKLEQ